jgi:hypothetical protein
MRKKLELNSDIGVSGSRKYTNKAMMAPVMGSGEVCVWRESGVRQSILCWCIWQGYGFSRREDVFTLNLVYKRFFYKCTFNAICKDIAAINCITVQLKIGSFPSTLTGHMLG